MQKNKKHEDSIDSYVVNFGDELDVVANSNFQTKNLSFVHKHIIEKIVNEYPNDMELGYEIRKWFRSLNKD